MSDIANEIKEFLDSHKFIYHEGSNDFQMNCFSCGETRKRLGISKKTGAWSCLNGGCGVKGSKLSTLKFAIDGKKKIVNKKIAEKEKVEVSKLKKDAHVEFIEPLFDKEYPDALNYLTKDRKLSIECIKHFQLGTRFKFPKKSGRTYETETDFVTIPYIRNGECVDIKHRNIAPSDKSNKWIRTGEGVSALFNGDITKNHDYDEITIFEAEIDCMSAWAMGLNSVISLVNGAKGFKVAWADQLMRYKRINILLDNDSAGQEGARKLADRLGLGRCYNTVLPEGIKDVNEWLQKGATIDDLEDILDKAERFKVAKVKSGTDLANDLYDKKFVRKDSVLEPKYDTPWRKINRILGPLRNGFLFVLAGKPKSGKTTVALNLMKYWGANNIPTAIYSCEMRGERLLEKWFMMVEKVFTKPDDIDEISHIRNELNLPLDKMFTFEPTEQEELSIEGVVTNVEAIVSRYGTKIVIVDNLHYLCRGENENALLSVATQQLKLLAERLNIVLIAITHPRKTNSNKQLNTDDLKGSSTIFQDADVVWLMHRLANNGNLTPDEIKKGGDGALSPLAEIGVTGRFTDGGKGALALIGGRSLFLDHGPTYKRLISDLVGKFKKKKEKVKGF